ncbi:hypothetical protein [Dysgonomonas sp. ZJ279]|uniref:hypothetical protein n=1 Tax=Dysgonomonas sp. ZJ279 TaxID=2709796 RepID=UPI0013EA2A09|nr:hypothetical protein [Dysgonomonas sp. ZJ279]
MKKIFFLLTLFVAVSLGNSAHTTEVKETQQVINPYYASFTFDYNSSAAGQFNVTFPTTVANVSAPPLCNVSISGTTSKDIRISIYAEEMRDWARTHTSTTYVELAFYLSNGETKWVRIYYPAYK